MVHQVQPHRLCHRPNLGTGLTFVVAQASIPLGVDIAAIAWLLFDEAHCLERAEYREERLAM